MILSKRVSRNYFLTVISRFIKNQPDGCAEDNHKTIGYFEIKPIKHARNYKKTNINLHQLCTSFKPGTAEYKRKHMFQVMAARRFTIIKIIHDVLVVSELGFIRLPLSLDELPQLIPYLNVVKVHRHQ
ncbi:hypothetical protein BD408DRAFT_467720 [Parasitella parasitica]|nr:hypothetical protein BD408DRAFT_467720 [Parasitella parasitica]